MNISMGPVLSLRETKSNEWHVSALVIVPSDQQTFQMTASPEAIVSPATLLLTHKKDVVLRYDLVVQRGTTSKKITYTLDGQTWSFQIPALGTNPKMAFVSCNGFSDPKAMKHVGDKNALWKHMKSLDEIDKYDVLIMGGDQVYADQIWNIPELEKWSDLSRSKRRKNKFTKLMSEQVDEFYFSLYKARWAQPDVAAIFSSIPTAMMWDDHDIFDGWGSYSPEDQDCPVYKGIFEAAKQHFLAFQQQVKPMASEKRPSILQNQDQFTYTLEIDEFAILALDTRSERSQKQVMSAKSWNAIWDWASQLKHSHKGGPKHLLVVSPVPVVHADFGSIETAMNWIPGEQELEDDLRDHWQSEPHRKERLRMIHRLFTLMKDKGIRATILSGDVHCAGLGVIESKRSSKTESRARVLNQLTSSGIVHPAPPKIMGYLLENLSSEPEEVDQGLSAYMLNFPAKRKKFVLARNFLSLEPDEKSRLWANWHIEGELGEPSTKVINPIEVE